MWKARVSGLRDVVSKRQREDPKIHKAWIRGLKKAGLFLQKESLKLVPVETGALKGSAFTSINKEGRNGVSDVIVGYTASYAVYVHEDLTKAHGAMYNRKYRVKIAAGLLKKKKPNETAKFLEIPSRNVSVQLKMKDIVAAEVQQR